MIISTFAQRDLVTAIEKELDVEFLDEIKNRKEVSFFIQQNIKQLRVVNKNNKRTPMPTRKQMCFIKNIENILRIEYTGNCYKDAYDFIKDNITEFFEASKHVYCCDKDSSHY